MYGEMYRRLRLNALFTTVHLTELLAKKQVKLEYAAAGFVIPCNGNELDRLGISSVGFSF